MMNNRLQDQRCLITTGWRTTILLVALTGCVPALFAVDPFADKPPTADEMHARRLYVQYKTNKEKEAGLKVSIDKLQKDVLSVYFGGGAMNPRVHAEDLAELDGLRQQLKTAREMQQNVITAWDKKFYGRYSHLQTPSVVIDSKTKQQVDGIEFELAHFRYDVNDYPKTATKTADSRTQPSAVSAGNSTSAADKIAEKEKKCKQLMEVVGDFDDGDIANDAVDTKAEPAPKTMQEAKVESPSISNDMGKLAVDVVFEVDDLTDPAPFMDPQPPSHNDPKISLLNDLSKLAVDVVFMIDDLTDPTPFMDLPSSGGADQEITQQAMDTMDDVGKITAGNLGTADGGDMTDNITGTPAGLLASGNLVTATGGFVGKTIWDGINDGSNQASHRITSSPPVGTGNHVANNSVGGPPPISHRQTTLQTARPPGVTGSGGGPPPGGVHQGGGRSGSRPPTNGGSGNGSGGGGGVQPGGHQITIERIR